MENLQKIGIAFVFLGILLYYFLLVPEGIIIPDVEDGFTAPGWENIGQIFRDQIKSGRLKGGAFSVYYKGELVVEVYGGYADYQNVQRTWSKSTVSQLFSTTKAVASVVMAVLVERGLLNYNDPVSKYWPEFAQNGKQNITLEQVLSHQAGLTDINIPFTYMDIMEDDEKISGILASQKPSWTPGETFGYHPITIGLYEDQIVKRVDPKGRSLSQFFHEEIALPFNIDIFIGLPKSENYRCARNVNDTKIKDILFSTQYWGLLWAMQQPNSWFNRAFRYPRQTFELDGYYNDPRVREVPSPATHGYATATAVAKLFGILANGGKHRDKFILSKQYIKMMQEPLVGGMDKVFNYNWTFGRGHTIWTSPLGSNTFGAPGAGGQVAKCDPGAKVGLGFITNYMIFQALGDGPNYLELETAVYEILKKFEDAK